MTRPKQPRGQLDELRGRLTAVEALVAALTATTSSMTREGLRRAFEFHVDKAREAINAEAATTPVRTVFEQEVARLRSMLAAIDSTHLPGGQPTRAETVLLTMTRVDTFNGLRAQTSASGFFFRRDDRLYLVTNRHVLFDPDSEHFPDRLEIEIHTDEKDLRQCARFTIPLYSEGLGVWRDATDSGGAVDVAVVEIQQNRLPVGAVLQCFDPSHLDARQEDVVVGDALTILGFPLGFHDTVHHLAVARTASLASAYGVRFQQHGYFLTDARTHRGSSGAPVLRRRLARADGASPDAWQLLGVHSTRMDMGSRSLTEDESLGLNCAWYADVLMRLTDNEGRHPG